MTRSKREKVVGGVHNTDYSDVPRGLRIVLNRPLYNVAFVGCHSGNYRFGIGVWGSTIYCSPSIR